MTYTRQILLGAFLLLSLGLMLMSSCTNVPNTGGTANADEAAKFMANVEKRLMELSIKSGRADWVRSTYITDDTEKISADANTDLIAATTEFAEESKKFDGVDLPADLQRKLKLLKLSTRAKERSRAQRAD